MCSATQILRHPSPAIIIAVGQRLAPFVAAKPLFRPLLRIATLAFPSMSTYYHPMSELPPNIDAILASIRSRMNDEAPPPPPQPAMAEPTQVVADVGTVVLDNGTMTLETLIRSLLEPMLKNWLDANMPEIVERLAQNEIKRLTGQI